MSLTRIGPGSGRGSRRRAASGACSSASSRGSDGRGSSSRSAFSTSTTCEVGATPSRSSSAIFSMWSRTADSSRAIRVDLLFGQREPGQARDVEDLSRSIMAADSRARAARRALWRHGSGRVLVAVASHEPAHAEHRAATRPIQAPYSTRRARPSQAGRAA